LGAYWQQIGLIALLILWGAFFAAGEMAVISARPVRMRQLAEEGNRSAAALLRLTEDPSRFLATIQVGITLANFLASASAAVGLSEPLAGWLSRQGLPAGAAHTLAVVAVAIIVSYFSLVFGELAPKRMALQYSERIALFVARPVAFLSKVAGPFATFLTASTNLVVRLLGGKVDQRPESITEEELRFYVEEHQELRTEEKQLIAGVFEFGDRLVRHLMVPRPDMDCIQQDTPAADAVKQVRAAGYWRFPVYRQDYDDIVGIVTVKDLLYATAEGKGGRPVAELMRLANFVPETKRALALLKEMQSRDEQVAIVVDEYGGVAGLVTLEDLLEEIVGEIRDELPPPLAGGPPGELILDAADSLEETEDRLNVSLPSSPYYETLAGFILHMLGDIPAEGATLDVTGWQLVVERMEGRRIDAVRAIPRAEILGTAEPPT
jgi:putative hemolysin